MPEELAIVIAVLIGAIWLIVKVFQGIGTFFDETHKAAEKKRLERFTQGKSKLSAAVSLSLPKELDRADKRLKTIEVEFAQIQRTNKWSAESPRWSNEDFKPHDAPSKRGTYAQMDSGEVDSILIPNDTTWLEEEAAILSRQCSYPFRPPA